MTQVKGKNGIVTFDVVTENEEARRLLDQAISSALGSLINTDISRLKQMLGAAVPQKKQTRRGES